MMDNLRLQRPKAVHVRWLDCTSQDGWTMPTDIEEIGCPVIETIGWLTVETKEFISVSVAWEPLFGKIAGTFTIPRRQILAMKSVRLKKEPERRA